MYDTYVNIDYIVLHRKGVFCKVGQHTMDLVVRFEVDFTLKHQQILLENQRNVAGFQYLNLNLFFGTLN